MEKNWWKEGVVYQIYPRSFNDSNGDGIGDIPGILEKLDYIESLGVDILWLNPVYSSPNVDNGYDISDYRNIMKDFGTLQDFDRLNEEVHKRGLRLIMDLVVNHSSDQHSWFIESRKSSHEDNPYRDYYIWRDPTSEGNPPNGWVGYFQDPAWTWDDQRKQYYLHLFCPEQPDMNWENPRLRQEVYDVMNFWLDKGIDGFRMDVISLLSKDYRFIDGGEESAFFGQGFANGPRIHEFIQEMHRETLSGRDVMTVGEATQVNVDQALDYVDASRKELDMLIHFDAIMLDCGQSKWDRIPLDMDAYRRVLNSWYEKMKGRGWNCHYMMNHDQPRTVSRYGDPGRYRRESAKLLLTHQLSLQATPFIYQGEEIGMINTPIRSIEDCQDVESLNFYRNAREEGMPEEDILKALQQCSRDHSRTPMQWDARPGGGFSSSTPWLPLNPSYQEINVEEAQKDPHSVLQYFKAFLSFRKKHRALIYGDFDILDWGQPHSLVYSRSWENETWRVLMNWSSEKADLSSWIKGDYQWGNYAVEPQETDPFRPWEVRLFKS